MDEALIEAVKLGLNSEVESLLAKGVSPCLVDDEGITLLHYTASVDDSKLAMLLIKYGSEVGTSDIEGNTALHTAAMAGSYNVCKILVESGADVKAKNNLRKTPLDLAEKRDKNLAAALRRWHSEFCEWEKKRAQEEASKRPLRSSPSSNNISGTIRSSAQVTNGDTLPTGTWEELQRMVLDARAEVRRMQMEFDKQNQILLEREGQLASREKNQAHVVAQADLVRRQLAEKEMELAQANSRLLADQNELKRRMEAVEQQALSVPVVSAHQIEWKKKIGAGAFAEVWKGYWRGSHVAIKRFFPPGEGYNTEVSAGDLHDMFLRELRIMTRNPHRNIVSVLAANVDPNHRLIILEYCKKGDLFATLHSGIDIPHSTRMRWALETARAINHLHEGEPTLIHRDIKTSNLLLDDRGVLKLTDFGFCAAVGDRDFSYTQHRLISKATRGTPAYMSPEQIKGEGYSTKSDVFSFGTVLWELWTRRIPWEGKDPTSILAELSIGSRLPIQESLFPTGVPLLIQRCWLEDPHDRPDMLEVINTLRNIKRATLGKPPAAPLKRPGTANGALHAASPPPQPRTFVAGTKPQNILPTQLGLLSPRNRDAGMVARAETPPGNVPGPSPILARASQQVPQIPSPHQPQTSQQQQQQYAMAVAQQQFQPAAAAQPSTPQPQQPLQPQQQVHQHANVFQPGEPQQSVPATQIQSPTPVYSVSKPVISPILPAAAVEPLRSQHQRISEIVDTQRKLLQSTQLSPEALRHIQAELDKRQNQLVVVQEQLLRRRPTIRPITPKIPPIIPTLAQPLPTTSQSSNGIEKADSPPPPPPPEEDEPSFASPRQMYLAAREGAASPAPDPHVIHAQQQRQQQRHQLIQQIMDYEQQLLSPVSPGQPVTPPPPSQPPLPVQQHFHPENAPSGQPASAAPAVTPAEDDDPWGMLEALLDGAPTASPSVPSTRQPSEVTSQTQIQQQAEQTSYQARQVSAQAVTYGPNEAQQYQFNTQQPDASWQDWQYYAYQQGLTAEQVQQYQQYHANPH